MTRLLMKLVKNGAGTRGGYARLSGIVGILCNLFLSAAKFAIGALSGSVAVTADALNNLTDSATNVITLTGTRLSGRPDDKEHPFGHGRMEYISALIVAVSIFVVSFELAKSSVEKILHPKAMVFSTVYLAVLGASVLVKLWMAYFNFRLYRVTENLNLKAVQQDSINDCIATAATMLSLLLTHLLGVQWLDGVISLGVAVFIFTSGAALLKQVVSPLLGEAPSRALTDRMEAIITESDLVFGVHDLVLHSYGAERRLASADAEVDATADIFTLHEVIDTAEKKIGEELGIVMCIHMDPVNPADADTKRYQLLAQGILREYHPALSLHDFRLSERDGKKTASFDLVLPFDAPPREEIRRALDKRFQLLCPELTVEYSMEHSYIAKEKE